MEAEYPELRGIKRASNISVEDLRSEPKQPQRTPQGPTVTTTEPELPLGDVHSPLSEPLPTFLVFCKDCGEQRPIRDEVCRRCSSYDFVDSPLQVTSWLDEEKERDALESYFNAPLKAETADTPRRTSAEFESPEEGETDIYHPVNHTVFSSFTSSSTAPFRHRLDILHRHARGEQLKSGWDGSPNEMHYYNSCNYLTAAHYYGDHSSDASDLAVNLASTKTWTSTTTSACTTVKTPTNKVEALAARLHDRHDYDHLSCCQLLDALDMHDGSELQLGLTALDKNGETPKVLRGHVRLTKYLNDYLRWYGLRGTTSTIGVKKLPAVKDYQNTSRTTSTASLMTTLTWRISVGLYSGGRVWSKSSSTSTRNGGGQRWDNLHKLLSFHSTTRRMWARNGSSRPLPLGTSTTPTSGTGIVWLVWASTLEFRVSDLNASTSIRTKSLRRT